MNDDLTYKNKWNDPRWLTKRERLLEVRGACCESCNGTKGLTIHHGYYRFKADPWDYEDETLWILCWPCHEQVQKKLVTIHRRIGRIGPKDVDNGKALRSAIDAALMETEFGVSKEEVDEILREEREAETSQYAEYEICIFTSSHLGPTRGDEMFGEAENRFPGINVNMEPHGHERDCSAVVAGPDARVVAAIQKWCEKWSS